MPLLAKDMNPQEKAQWEQKLFSSIKSKNYLWVEHIILQKGVSSNTKNEDGQTALHIALDCPQPDLKIVEFLLKQKADPNALDNFDQTPILILYQNSVNKEAADLMLKYGATPLSQKTLQAMTVLAEPAKEEPPPKTVQIEHTESVEEEPTQKIVQPITKPVEEILPQKTIQPAEPDKVEKLPVSIQTKLQDAIEYGLFESAAKVISEAEQDYSTGKSSKKPNWNAPLPNGFPPLFLAILTSQVNLIRLLVSHGADPNQTMVFGGADSSCLMAAVISREPEAVRELLFLGADVSQRTSTGWSAIMMDSSDYDIKQTEAYEEIKIAFFDKFWIQRESEMKIVWGRCYELNPNFGRLEKIEQARVLNTALASSEGGVISFNPGYARGVKLPRETLRTLQGDCDDIRAVYQNALFLIGFHMEKMYNITINGVATTKKSKKSERIDHGIMALNYEGKWYQADPLNNYFNEIPLVSPTMDDVKNFIYNDYIQRAYSEVKPREEIINETSILKTSGREGSDIKLEKLEIKSAKDEFIYQIGAQLEKNTQ